MEFEKLLETRESVRMFKDEPVKKEDLLKILNAGRLAPTAKNLQPQKIYVLTKEEDLKLVDEVTPCRFGSRTVLMVCSDLNVAYKNENPFCSDEMDASIVSSFMLLASANAGVGSLWVERFKRDEAHKVFNLPENIKVELFMMLGYQANNYPGSPNKGKRKPLEETVIYR